MISEFPFSFFFRPSDSFYFIIVVASMIVFIKPVCGRVFIAEYGSVFWQERIGS